MLPAWWARRAAALRLASLSPPRAAVFAALQAAAARAAAAPPPARAWGAAACAPTAALVLAALRARAPAPLRVAPSARGPGRGVFAARALALGELLALFGGVVHGAGGDEAPDGAGGAGPPPPPPRDSAYAFARGDGVVVDAAALAPPAALAAVLARATPWATAHMAQHGARPDAVLMPVDLAFEPASAAALPYEFAGAPPGAGACPPGGGWPALGAWAAPRVPGAVLLALRDVRAGEEVVIDYAFDALGEVPAWLELVAPSTKWEAHEAACAAAGTRAPPRPPAADARFADAVGAAADARAAARARGG